MKNIDIIKDMLAGSFYQMWAEYEDSMQSVVKGMFKDSTLRERQSFCDAVGNLLKEIENIPEVKKALLAIGQNYDASDDGLSQLEWLVLLKFYFNTGDISYLNRVSSS